MLSPPATVSGTIFSILQMRKWNFREVLQLASYAELLNGRTEILPCTVLLTTQYSVVHGDHNLDASLTAIFGCLSSTARGQTSLGYPLGLNYPTDSTSEYMSQRLFNIHFFITIRNKNKKCKVMLNTGANLSLYQFFSLTSEVHVLTRFST